METIDILTGQHVIIGYKPASVAQRMGALLIDGLLQTAYLVALYTLLFVPLDYAYSNSWWAISFFIVLLLPPLTYHFLFEWLMNGQTPGKRLLRIRVTNDDGSATRVGAYFLRWLLRPIDLLFYGGVGALCIMLTKKHQRLGDLAAGTVVVQTQPRQGIFRSDYYTFPPNYQPKYPQAASLSAGQVRLITKMLSAAPRASDETRLHTLAQKVHDTLKTGNVSKTTGSRLFLEEVLRDYHYYDALGV